MKLPLVVISLPLLFALLSNPAASAAAKFYELGSIEGGSYAEPTAVSANGRVVVGYVDDSNLMGHPFRQVRFGELDVFPVTTGSFGIGVSANGSTVVANSDTPDGNSRAFLWSKKTGIAYIETDSGFTVDAVGISGNGKVVCGYLHDLDSSTSQPIRWSAKTGIRILGGSLETGGDPSAANYNGDVIVGGIWTRRNGHQACRWVRNEIFEVLPDHGMSSFARAVNFRGNIATGHSVSADGIPHAVRWATDSGMQVLNPTTPSYAVGISADGNRIVGNLIRLTEGGWLHDQGSFIWTPRIGLRNMDDYFRKTLPHGWRLLAVAGISGDGRWIIGIASSHEGRRGFILDTGVEHSQQDK